MASRIRFLRAVAPAPTDVDLQQMVYDLVLARATTMFGPGSSFAVTIRTGDESDTLFGETVAETLAWDVSLGLDARDLGTSAARGTAARNNAALGSAAQGSAAPGSAAPASDASARRSLSA